WQITDPMIWRPFVLCWAVFSIHTPTSLQPYLLCNDSSTQTGTPTRPLVDGDKRVEQVPLLFRTVQHPAQRHTTRKDGVRGMSCQSGRCCFHADRAASPRCGAVFLWTRVSSGMHCSRQALHPLLPHRAAARPHTSSCRHRYGG